MGQNLDVMAEGSRLKIYTLAIIATRSITNNEKV